MVYRACRYVSHSLLVCDASFTRQDLVVGGGLVTGDGDDGSRKNGLSPQNLSPIPRTICFVAFLINQMK